MKINLLTAIAMFVFSFSAFASGTQHGDHSNHGKKMKHKERVKLSDSEQKEVISALEANEALHASFFTYDAKKVESNAVKLSEAIKKISNSEVKKLLEFSLTKIADIKAGNDRDKNNQNYHLASMALIHIVNKYDVGDKYNAYSCPMVKKKWIQNSKKMAKVHNPYAPEMPHCGSQDSHF